MRPPTAALPVSLSGAMRAGFVAEHGRAQQLDSNGAVVSDARLANVQAEWRPPLDAVLDEWHALPEEVPSLSLVSVYARGSLPRGLALPGISDVDTLGFATFRDSDHAADALAKWRKRGSARAERLRRTFPFCAGSEMRLVAVSEDSSLGRWLHGETPEGRLSQAELMQVDAFRLASQAALLHGEDLVSRLPPPVPRPRLMLSLRPDIARAANTIGGGGGDHGEGEAALLVARWAAKRALRSGMELAAPSCGHFSRDLLPCHRAISTALGEPCASRSLAVLQMACMSTEAVKEHGGPAVVAARLVEASKRLADALESVHLSRHFEEPLTTFEQLPAAPPLANQAGSSSAPAANKPIASAFGAMRAKAVAASEQWKRQALLSAAHFASPLHDVRSPSLVHDHLRPLSIDAHRLPSHSRVLDLDWTRHSSPEARARVERIAGAAIASGRRPVVLRGAASQLAPLGEPLWGLAGLQTIVPRRRVRVSPDATFRFVRPAHPLCVAGEYPLPSHVVPFMDTSEFVRRVTHHASSPPPPPLHYPEAAAWGGERYYLQADVPDDVLSAKSVPKLWRSLIGAGSAAHPRQAQPLRLGVSTHGATTPLHFDMAGSFLAQMRGSKRLVFFPPHAMEGLYPYPVDHPLHRRARVSLYAPPAERAEDFPRFGDVAEGEGQVLDLNEGDVVVFPPFWFHHVETTSALSCSVGCRYV